MSSKTLPLFILKVLLYLIPMFVLWYGFAPLHLAPTVAIAQHFFQWVMADVVMWVKLQSTTVIVASHYGLNAVGEMVTPPITEAAGFTLNPLSFGYGLPFLLALILASSTSDKVLKLLISFIIMSLVQCVILLVAILKAVVFGLGSTVIHWSPLALDSVALLYQVGFLFIPMIAPLIIWAVLCEDFVKGLGLEGGTFTLQPK